MFKIERVLSNLYLASLVVHLQKLKQAAKRHRTRISNKFIDRVWLVSASNIIQHLESVCYDNRVYTFFCTIIRSISQKLNSFHAASAICI